MQGTRFLHHFSAHLCRKMKRIRARPSSRERDVGRFTRVLNALPRVLLFFEFLWWRLKRFIMRFTPDCVQKNPLTFLFFVVLTPCLFLSSILTITFSRTGHRRFHVQNRQARSRQVPLCRRRHLHRQKMRRTRPSWPQLGSSGRLQGGIHVVGHRRRADHMSLMDEKERHERRFEVTG